MLPDGGPRQATLDQHAQSLASGDHNRLTTAAIHVARMNLTPQEHSYVKAKVQQIKATPPVALQAQTVAPQLAPVAETTAQKSVPQTPNFEVPHIKIPVLDLKGFKAIGNIKNPAHRGAAVEIVKLAHEFLGTPYVYGGESPKGFDCSGLAQFMYQKAGISIPRDTYHQWGAGQPIGKRQLQPGDLVFFKGSDSIGGLPGHVGIYIGGGKMIDAPHTGSHVRVESVFSFGGYMGARRYG